MLYLYAMTFNDPKFWTKTPRYKMRGELRTPKPPEDYCRKGLCPPGVNHIACDNPFWGPQCKKPREGVNMDRLKSLIVDHHNWLRRLLTRTLPVSPLDPYLGDLPTAKHFPKVQWDQELSILAMRVTNFCNDEKASECVNTPRFLNVGKSTMSHSNPVRQFPEAIITQALYFFGFGPLQNVDSTFVTSFPSDASSNEYALANIINDKVRYVGCGILLQRSGINWNYHITCLYNEKARPGEQLYETV
ncbi:venom allergen 3-like [Drosophila innubila]|uniref:venom allergen 3-like n=1 Tax=Drosophila innubila TaxID=198719 RepID=UPI00148C5873|nr:venom allergen 3-like [Drosophila innubila]